MKTITSVSRDSLLNLAKEYKIYLEGNILKLLKAKPNDTEFEDYLKTCVDRDLTFRRKRLEVTKQVQRQVRELESISAERERLMAELQIALDEANQLKEAAEKEKDTALSDLELLQKKKQFELINQIIKMALWIILGVGLITSGLFMYSLYRGIDSPIIESTWSNLFGILLTNAFSIIGTIMGVRYANKEISNSESG
jgi:hypothetical protein